MISKSWGGRCWLAGSQQAFLVLVRVPPFHLTSALSFSLPFSFFPSSTPSQLSVLQSSAIRPSLPFYRELSSFHNSPFHQSQWPLLVCSPPACLRPWPPRPSRSLALPCASRLLTLPSVPSLVRNYIPKAYRRTTVDLKRHRPRALSFLESQLRPQPTSIDPIEPATMSP